MYSKIVYDDAPGNIEVSMEDLASLVTKYHLQVGDVDLGPWTNIQCPVKSHPDNHPSLGLAACEGKRKDGTEYYRLAISHKSENHNCSHEAIYTALGIQWYRQVETEYTYVDKDGKYCYTKHKLERFDGYTHNRLVKNFHTRVDNERGGYDSSKGCVKRAGGHKLYALPKLINWTGDVFVVEGEKDAEVLLDAGYVATSSDNGAKSWQPEFGEYLKQAARVIIIPDNDESGKLYLKTAAYSIILAGNTNVFRLSLPDLDKKGDIYEWMEVNGYMPADLDNLVNTRLQLIRLEDVEDVKLNLNKEKKFSGMDLPPGYEDILKELHESYFYLTEHGRSYLTQVVFNEESGLSFSKTNVNGLASNMYAGYIVYVPATTKKGEETFVPVNLIDYWNQAVRYNHPYGPKTYSRLEFDPRPDAPKNIFNLYRGLTIEPTFDADVSEWLDFVENKVCSRDQEAYTYFLSFFAHLFQRPHVLPMVSLVIRGHKGCGKSGTVDLMRRIIGRMHSVLVDNWSSVTGRFNSHMAAKLLVMIDDATWGGYKEIGPLNNLITGQTLSIEAKHQNACEVSNYARVVIVGNSEWLVPKTADDRRFFIIEMPGPFDNFNYKAFFEHWQQPEQLSKMLGYLLKYDISNWSPISIIQKRTVGYEMILQDLSPLEKFLLWLASENILDPRMKWNFTGNESEYIQELVRKVNEILKMQSEDITFKDLRTLYRLWCDSNRIVDDKDATRFSKVFYRVLDIDPKDKTKVYRKGQYKDLYWKAPPLDKFREILCQKFRLPSDYFESEDVIDKDGGD